MLSLLAMLQKAWPEKSGWRHTISTLLCVSIFSSMVITGKAATEEFIVKQTAPALKEIQTLSSQNRDAIGEINTDLDKVQSDLASIKFFLNQQKDSNAEQARQMEKTNDLILRLIENR